MNPHLKGIVLGDPQSNKTAFLQALSLEKSQKSAYQIKIKDPVANSYITFNFEEANLLPKSLIQYQCIIMLYSINDHSSFKEIKNSLYPQIQASLSSESSFIIIIGLQSEFESDREVNSEEADEFATENGAFHIEVSISRRKNIELLLKVMRIRATLLLKKQPKETSKSFDLPKRKLDLDSIPKIDIEDCTTPQFSSRTSKQSKSIGFENAKQVPQRKNRYEDEMLPQTEPSYDNLRLNTYENDMSFANISEIGNFNYSVIEDILSNEEYDSGLESESESDLICIDTLGSPSCQQQYKVPPLSVVPAVPIKVAQRTERAYTPDKKLKNGFETERPFKDPLLVLEIKMKYSVKRIEVYNGDTSAELAKKVCENYEDVDELSLLIENEVNNYCCEIRNIQKSMIH